MSNDTNQLIYKIHKPKPRYPVIKEIRERFSPRFFTNEPIKKSHLQAMLEASRWAPSGHNQQPWFYYVIHKGTRVYTDVFSTLNPYNRSWAHTAPVLVLACAITRNEKGHNPFAVYDLGASVFSFVLQAQSLGYYARQMGLFDKKKVKTMILLEKYMEPFVIIAIGKIGNYTQAPQEIIKLERDPRPRKTNIAQEL